MASTSIGALIGMGLGAYGEKPKVPEFERIDATQVQQDTAKGNIASFADIAKLATSVNQFNQSELDALIDRILPGAREQIASTIGSQLRGEVPEDVSRAISRSSAARAVAGGYGGSMFARSAEARDLGLTSLNLISQGLSSAQSWLQQASAPQMDVTSMFFTPQQRLSFEQSERNAKYQRDLLAAGVKAAPDPAMAALAQGIDQDVARIENAAISYFGGGIGGGGGGGGSGLSSAKISPADTNFSFTDPRFRGY